MRESTDGYRYYPGLGWHQPVFELETRPEYSDRWTRLVEELREGGVDERDWPYRPEGINGEALRYRWRLQLAVSGEGAVLDALEKCWREDSRNRRRGPRASSLGWPRAELEQLRDRLIKEGKPAGYKALASISGLSQSSVRRRLDRM